MPELNEVIKDIALAPSTVSTEYDTPEKRKAAIEKAHDEDCSRPFGMEWLSNHPANEEFPGRSDKVQNRAFDVEGNLRPELKSYWIWKK